MAALAHRRPDRGNGALIDSLGVIAGAPVALEAARKRPGRTRTRRARGSRMSVVVKEFGSTRSTLLAARRVTAMAAGPRDPLVPTLLHIDPDRNFIVVSDVPGQPLRDALLAPKLVACRRAGAALGRWHAAWTGAIPDGVAEHTAAREIETISLLLAKATPSVARAVGDALPLFAGPWLASTVVHRDLHEEQILIGDRVGFVDLDDAVMGPPEFDLGNLVGHLELLEKRRRVSLVPGTRAFLDGYEETGPVLDRALLDRCRALTMLRLACLNDNIHLVRMVIEDRAVAQLLARLGLGTG